MSNQVILLFMIALSLFLMQSIGGYFQIKDYQKAVKRVHKNGNVGLGQKRGRFFSGHIVMISCDKNGVITGGEVLDGITFLSKFHPIKNILGKNHIGESIYVFLCEFRKMDKKSQKQNLGYIRSLEALEQRLASES